MIELEDWVRSEPFPRGGEWLVMGKGPTFAHRGDVDLSRYVTVSLNHVVTEQAVDVAHMIDFDVAEACAEAVRDNSSWLVMPRHPHIGFRPSLLRLDELIVHNPVLAELDREGRVVVYDLTTPDAPEPGAVQVRYFSSEAAVALAARMGASSVRTLGIDGGTAYAGSFSALDSTTRLANGQPSFSLQFERLDEIAREHAIDVEPVVEPLKVYVGVQERELIAARVLEYTISEHATEPVLVRHLPPVTRTPQDPRQRQRTPFSFSRFLIPELAGYRGRALYVDSDMHVFDDITQLWKIPFDGATVLCTNQTFIPPQWRDNPDFHPGRQMSVMMLDCENLSWKIDEIIDQLDAGTLTYEQLMFEMGLVKPEAVTDALPEAWNHLEHYEPGETKLLHYTAIPTQPWKSEDNPNRELWEDAFVRACRAGYIDRELVERHVKAGHVRASLLPLVPETAPPKPTLTSAMAAELEATRNALALRGGPLARAAGRVALERMRQSPGWTTAGTRPPGSPGASLAGRSGSAVAAARSFARAAATAARSAVGSARQRLRRGR